jgi:hypothetical protein
LYFYQKAITFFPGEGRKLCVQKFNGLPGGRVEEENCAKIHGQREDQILVMMLMTMQKLQLGDSRTRLMFQS